MPSPSPSSLPPNVLHPAATKEASASTYKSGPFDIVCPFTKEHPYNFSDMHTEVDLHGLDIGVAK